MLVVWIAIAAVLLGLVVLALSGGSLLGRLRPLRRAATTLLRRRAEAEKLQAAAQTLAQEAETLRLKAEITQERIALIKVKQPAPGR